jgi:signal transduction histidine kinase
LRSIQRALLAWLALALVFGMALVVVFTYANAYAQITRVFDDELIKVAEAVSLGEEWRGPHRARIPRPGFNLSVRAYDQRGVLYFESALPSMPEDVPRLFETAFADVATRAGRWHIYTHVLPEGVIQVGQPELTRQRLARDLSLRMALPELVVVPLLLFFVAWVLRRGLGPLAQVSRRVKERDAARLDALPTGGVPEELLPLIEEINALLARLAATIEAQRRFVADAAHELRTPVAALALQAQVAERAAQPAARSAAFTELHKGIARAARVVEQLLKLARLGPDGVPEPMREVDLAELAREVVGSMALTARAQGVDLGADAPGRAPMRGAAAELRTLVTNLVENAVRYAPRDSEVTVEVRAEPGGVRMTVTDAGPGIRAEERARVFERFGRASDDQTPGLGLGLAIAKAIVERHGGRISLEDAHPGAAPPGLAAVVVLPSPQS